jgi:hypothetical protein
VKPKPPPVPRLPGAVTKILLEAGKQRKKRKRRREEKFKRKKRRKTRRNAFP